MLILEGVPGYFDSLNIYFSVYSGIHMTLKS